MEREEVAGREEDAESRERKGGGGGRRLREKRGGEGGRKWRGKGGRMEERGTQVKILFLCLNCPWWFLERH